MSTSQTFVPTGTVRSRFSNRTDAPLDETLAALASIAGHEQCDPALVWTARRLVDNEETALDNTVRLHATLAVLALLIAIEEGSTRLPLSQPDHLDHILHRFQARASAVAAQLAARRPERAQKLEAAALTLKQARQADPAGVLRPDVLPTILAAAGAEGLPYRPLLLAEDSRALTSERMLRKERALADAFASQVARALDTPQASELADAIASLAAHPTRYRTGSGWADQQLNYEQANAVLLAALEPLALVTGGPGTGKTSIIVSILRLLTRLGVAPESIALAAPTGKASFRMRESIDGQLASLEVGADGLPMADRRLREGLREARTLHRLLEYSPKRDRFWRNAENRLESRVVICDEASMIDLDLMHALVEALPAKARLVLVGDADQLPSVAGGAVFRDLVADQSCVDRQRHALIEALTAEPARADTGTDTGRTDAMARFTGRLVHSYRMDADDPDGRSILELAGAIRQAQSRDDAALQRTLGEAHDLDELSRFGGVHRLAARCDRNDFVERWFAEFIAELPARQGGTDAGTFETDHGDFVADARADLKRLFDHYGRARLLCVTQVFRTGARAINRALHAHFAEQVGRDASTRFLHLEPVIAQQNNYELGVFNGDQGVVAYVSEKGRRGRRKQAIFPRPDGGFRMVPVSQIAHQLEHAYATSIHKSQGSEFDHVAVVLPEERMPLLTKQLLYTAVTRASTSVTIFDSAKLFEAGAATPVRRYTGLPARLADAMGSRSERLAEA